MRMGRSRSRRATLLLAASLATLAAACASGGARAAFRTDVRVEPTPPRDSGRAGPLPDLPVSQVASAPAPEPRIQRLDAVDEDIGVVVRGLAQSFGLGYDVDPAVRGRVTVRLAGATLPQALESVLAPKGFSYRIEGGILRVGPARVESRIFNLDYIAISRVGFGSTVVQRRLTNQGGGGNIGGAGNTSAVNGVGGAFGGGDAITSIEVADLWRDIRVSLEGIIFDASSGGVSAGESAAAPAVPGGLGAVGGTGGPSATSRVSPDGRRLIINPMAGTILVAAPAEKLAQVQAFLQSFEGSVQRQVLIEAKIVEVSLDRTFQFGIDWNAVQKTGNVSIGLGQPQAASQGGFSLTLSHGANEVQLVLHALQTQGDVQVLSSPRVSALNNQRAIFNVTTDQVFFSVTRQPILGPTGGTIGFTTQIQPQTVSVGIVLDVLPQIGPDNALTMNIRPVVTNLVRTEQLSLPDGTQASAPVIDRRETDTVVRCRAGETVLIGGLMQTRHVHQRGGVPLLRDIPLLGKVFTTYDDQDLKSELVIFLTPTIVAAQPHAGG